MAASTNPGLLPAHERGEVTPQMSALDRGRLPDHVAQPLAWALYSTVQRERRARRVGACKRAVRLARRRKRICSALVRHWRSFDKVNRPVTAFHPAQRFRGASSWAEADFFEDFGFWKDEFRGVCGALRLLPGVVQGKNRCTATREQALMVLLKRWRDPRPWEALARSFRTTRQWCTDIYMATHRLFVEHYLPLLKVIDFRRVIGAAADWAAAPNASYITGQTISVDGGLFMY